jgi:hypothetical protein
MKKAGDIKKRTNYFVGQIRIFSLFLIDVFNKAVKFVPAAKSAASTGLPTRCFGSRLRRR